jgi:L-ascorbate metabolism protein UlaG (beta-lactamase superfamily)
MELRRLSWAGIELTADGERLLVDPLQDVEPLRDFLGEPKGPLVPAAIDDGVRALVTHLHPDHCDRALLRRAGNRRVLCHDAIAATLRADGIEAIGVPLWETADAGAFRACPVPSQDWRGDDQVAWVIDADGHRIIHYGDTIWHGKWWEIERQLGPFAAAFLPINGVLARLEGFTPTEVPATLTPEQAIEAAIVLKPEVACAIHYGLFDNPPRYGEQPDAEERFHRAAERRGVTAVTPADGERVPLP